MARRNNLTLEEIVDKGNQLLRRSTCTPQERQGVCAMIENILHMADNYGGFSYLEAHEVPDGHAPGIIRGYDDQGNIDNTKNQYPDETRRHYSIKRSNPANRRKADEKFKNEFPISFSMFTANEDRCLSHHSVRDTLEEAEVVATVRKHYPGAKQINRTGPK